MNDSGIGLKIILSVIFGSLFFLSVNKGTDAHDNVSARQDAIFAGEVVNSNSPYKDSMLNSYENARQGWGLLMVLCLCVLCTVCTPFRWFLYLLLTIATLGWAGKLLTK